MKGNDLEGSTKLPQAWMREQYELVDFGSGRKLERFGGILLDRPSPAAELIERSATVDWSLANAQVDGRGKVIGGATLAPWQISFGGMRFNLRLTPFGHVGLFPEQVSNWCWLTEQLSASHGKPNPPQTLNLFGYTGGTTMALAKAGAHVVHVDASAPAVSWAKSNASSSSLQSWPIRWIVDDARKFIQRERRRGNLYDAIVMDPPSYGHGPKGTPWVLTDHLPELLDDAIKLLRHDGQSLLLFTAHCERPSAGEIVELIKDMHQPQSLSEGRLTLCDLRARQLDAGFYIRVRF